MEQISDRGETNKPELAAYDASIPQALSDKLAFVASPKRQQTDSQKKLAEANSEAEKLEVDIESYLKDIEKNGVSPTC